MPTVEPRTDIHGVKMTSEMKSNEFPKCRTGCPILSVELGFSKCERIQKSKDALYSFVLWDEHWFNSKLVKTVSRLNHIQGNEFGHMTTVNHKRDPKAFLSRSVEQPLSPSSNKLLTLYPESNISRFFYFNNKCKLTCQENARKTFIAQTQHVTYGSRGQEIEHKTCPYYR